MLNKGASKSEILVCAILGSVEVKFYCNVFHFSMLTFGTFGGMIFLYIPRYLKTCSETGKVCSLQAR